MSRDDVMERGWRILDIALPMSEEEAITVLRKHMRGLSRKTAKEIYWQWRHIP